MRRLQFLLVLVLSATIINAQKIMGFNEANAKSQLDWEKQYDAQLNAKNLDTWMQFLTSHPHHVGSVQGKANADYMVNLFRSWGYQTEIAEYQVLFPTPKTRVLELLGAKPYKAKLDESALKEDKTSGQKSEQLPPYNAYSADGDVTAELVYVNRGIPADYDELERMGISVKGKIVIAKYGGSWRGIKPKVAYEHGAIGCLIYSDPKDDGYYAGDVYPGGPYRPEFGAQRGSVMDMPIHAGDPLTPGWGSEPGGKKNRIEDSLTILKIPVLPISYGDATPILRQLKGKVVPNEWKGALPFTYHVGPGPAQVHMNLRFEWKNRPLYNVVARIPGTTRPDEWIIFGNHHDAWVSGADDPISGAVSLMETARGLAELLKTGWRPSRTIILALWDGEEWGLLGSTEWAEKHDAELKQKAAVYINSDGTGKGWLNTGGSHGLQQFMNEVAKDVNDPRTGKPVFDEARRRAVLGEPEADRKAAEADPSLRIAPLGSGSDFTPFLQHLTLSALSVGFGGESPGGVYHSAYDTIKWYQTYSDTDYSYGRTLSQLTGTLILRLADAPVLPFQFSDTADTLLRYVVELEKLAADKKDSKVDMKPVRAAVEALKAAGQSFEKAYASVGKANSQSLLAKKDLQQLNRLLLTSEQKLGNSDGLPRRDWFKHQIYAPGFYTGYGVKTMPQIREGLEEGRFTEAQGGVRTVSAAVNALAAQVKDAARALQASVK